MRFLLTLAGLALAGFLAGAAPAEATLIAYYRLDGNANDASGHGLHGTVSGATVASGHTGQGYHFDGSNDYIKLPLNITPSVLPQLTMGAWVRANTADPIRQVISCDNGGFDRSLGIDRRGGGTGWSAFAGSGGVVGWEPVALGAWTFVAVSYDQTTSQVMLYVDGKPHPMTGTMNGSNVATFIGCNPGHGEYFFGTIDDVFFYDEVLTAAQLNEIRVHGVGVDVPEPGSASLLLGGLACALGGLRRRRCKA